MEWLVGVAIPVAGIVGGLIGAWISRRSSQRSDTGALLISQLHALYADNVHERQAAREIIRGLISAGALNHEQLEAASTALKHWAAVNWGLSAEQRRNLEVGR